MMNHCMLLVNLFLAFLQCFAKLSVFLRKMVGTWYGPVGS